MDESGFTALYAETWREILGYALRRTENTADATDVVAEVFSVAWRRRADVPAGPDGRLWLFGVARRVAANQRRGELRRGALAQQLRDAVESASRNRADQSSADPANVVIARQDAATVLAGLRALPALDRDLLTLVAWEGLSPAQAAAVVGLTPVTGRVRLHRARQRLRRLLREPVQPLAPAKRDRRAGQVRSSGRQPVPVEEPS